MENNVNAVSNVASQAMFDIEKEHKKQKIQGIIKNIFVCPKLFYAMRNK